MLIILAFKFMIEGVSKDDQNIQRNADVGQYDKSKFKQVLGVTLGSDYEYDRSEYDASKRYYSGHYRSWEVEKCLKCDTGFDYLEPEFFGAETKLILHGEKLSKIFGVLVVIHCDEGTEQSTALQIRDIFTNKYRCEVSNDVTLIKEAEKFGISAGDQHSKFEYSVQSADFYAEIVGVTSESSIQVEGFERTKFDGFVVVLVVHPDFNEYVRQDQVLIEADKVKTRNRKDRNNYNSL